ncbi:hypothetical protein [Demequina mangrovi]|uniref:Phage terminase, small subunit, putative, P27 family n=1 Tax=Demequina mangrovi TaxID=1043493 RepID=A0A1H6Z6N7_9MICO|nr:hypothetical protein [Demequina mangrovi]SEJ45292.1 hypothetical protein SAMN05421637_1822 [Demequina mangrovi]
MPATPAPAAPSTADEWPLPDDWTPEARDVFLGVLDERPDLAGAELSSLSQAAALVSSADRLDEAARAAGYVSTGSMGQPVVHPASVESRLARTAAATILARLAASGPASRTAKARGAARTRWSGQ